MSSKNTAATSDDDDDDDEPVKKKGKVTKKATKGKTKKAVDEVLVKKGRAKTEEAHVGQELVEARKEEPKPEPVTRQKPAPRPIKKPLAVPPTLTTRAPTPDESTSSNIGVLRKNAQ